MRSTGSGFSIRIARIVQGARRDAGGSQPLQKVGAGDTARIDAQAQRRMAVAGGEYGLPVRRMVPLQARDPPRRMLPARHRVGVRQGQQLVAPAQEIAQARRSPGP
jgi:hypothetical protein